MPRRLYPVVIHKDEDSDFGAVFPDFAGYTTGGSVEDCLGQAEAFLADAVAFTLEEGDTLPEPTPVEEIDGDIREGAALIALAPVIVPGRAKRVTITIEEDLLAAIDARTSNRSGFLAEAARARLTGA